MTTEFLIYIPLFLIRDALKLKSRFWVAFFMALKRLPLALKGRRIERKAKLDADEIILSRINQNREARL